MEFKQLEAFVAVVDYKRFSEAAKHLYLTQPTISSHIQALEKAVSYTHLDVYKRQVLDQQIPIQPWSAACHP